MERREYSAGAVKLSFWFMEFRCAVELLDQGKTTTGIREMSRTENLFAASSPERAALIMSTVSARIAALDPSFVPLFVGSDISTQKLFCMTACLCRDSLFFDFVHEVVREKLILGLDTFSDSDLRAFFTAKQAQSEKVAGWKDDTVKRLSTCYKTMLSEAGLTDRGKTERRILRPVVDPEIVQWMKAHDLQAVLSALTGVDL